MPKIVPELRTITVGGAISGVGIEASSFKYGLIHSTIKEMDVLTGTGELLTCKSEGEHRDLFYGMPNSYGVFGYILRARVEIIPIKPYVQLIHDKFDDPVKAFQKLKESSEDASLDFVEGVVFAKEDIRILTGKFIEKPPQNYVLKDFRIQNIFYKQVRDSFEKIEYMPIKDFLWRWDADFYWGTENTLLQKRWIRKIFGEALLRSDRLLKLTKNRFFKFIQSFFQKESNSKHTLNQDIGIPFENWLKYYEWYCANIDKFPLWLCTTKANPIPLFQAENDLYCDFGVFSGVFPDKESCRQALQAMENKMLELKGIKCFYSENTLSKEAFFKIVNKSQYLYLKQKYDPDHTFPELFEKVLVS